MHTAGLIEVARARGRSVSEFVRFHQCRPLEIELQPHDLIALTSAALIAVALEPSSWIARLLGSKFFALGGKKYAFAMYIFHPLILEICTSLPIASKGLRLSLFAISTVLISGLSYRYLESYFLHMKVGGTVSKVDVPVSQPRDTPVLLKTA